MLAILAPTPLQDYSQPYPGCSFSSSDEKYFMKLSAGGALRPYRSDLEHYSNIVIRFFEEVTPRIFEVDMDSVSLVTVVRC